MIVILLSSAIAFRTPAGQVYAPGRETQSDLGDIEPLIDPAKIAWTQMNGPPGGNIRKLVQNPYRHNELYALSGNRLYRSRDKGENWQLVDKLRNMPVECVIPFKDGLFVCGDRVYYCDDQDNPKKILDEWFDQITISDNKLFVTGTRGRIEDFRILYTDLSSQNFDWKVITPSQAVLSDLVPPPKDIGFPSDVRPSNVIAIGNRILVNIVLLVQGSGQFSNGHLYSSEDLGKSWSKVDLDMPDGTVISNIIQDPQNPNHIILTLKHTIMHEAKSSLSKLIVQSFNGGRTWSPVTDLTFQSNGITDVDIVNSTHYIVCPFDGCIIKLSGSEDYEIMSMPTVKGFEGVTFFLDTLLFDLDDPNIVYGKTGSTWNYGLIKSEDNMKT